MKKTALILTLTAAVCAFASCGNEKLIVNETSPVIAAETAAADKNETTAADKNKTAAPVIKEEADIKPMNAAASSETPQDAAEASYEETTQEQSVQEPQGELDAAAGTAFKKGVSEGNVYTSEYAGFRFTAPEGTKFLDEADLETEYRMPLRFKNSDEKNFYLTGIKDASVIYDNAEGNMFIWFYNAKLRYPDIADLTAEDYIRYEVLSSEIGKFDITGPEKVTLCGNEYTKVTWTQFDYPHAAYVRRIDDDFIIAISAIGTAVDGFESRFETIG